MNTAGTIGMLTAKDSLSGGYRIPCIIYSDAYFSETVAYADLILPDTTYLERWDCISLLDRPISSPDGPADSIRQPVLPPERDVRPFQDVLLDLGVRLALPGMVDADGSAKFPNGYADYLVHHERRPGIGPLAGWRGADGSGTGCGEPNPQQLQRYIEHGCFWQSELAPEARFYKHANRAYLEYARAMGFIEQAEPIILQLYSEELQKFGLAAQGHGAVQPPRRHRERVRTYFDPLPFWYPPFEAADAQADFPLHAISQRPAAMYHSWGSMNPWLRPDPQQQPAVFASNASRAPRARGR
jgi:anaerobic selenocysteine-containing dehydrogenase